MNRLTRTPSDRASATSGARREASCGNAQPWSDVAWPASSGTKVHWCGRTARTNGIRLWNGLPSMLNSARGHCVISAASSCTSAARMWRSSGRGWTVMPCAPASSAMVAARVTLGMPSVRVLRSSATLLRLTDSAVVPRCGSRPVVSRGFIEGAVIARDSARRASPGECAASACPDDSEAAHAASSSARAGPGRTPAAAPACCRATARPAGR